MDDKENFSVSSLKEKMLEVADNAGSRELPFDDAYLKEFCELTGHDYSYCMEKNELPTGFFMTLTSPIVSEAFLSFFLKYPRLIKGVIHTGSKIEIISPLRLDMKPYREKIEVKNVEEKTGKKGKYVAADFGIVLMNASGERVATDVHQFFLRI